jgi:hypothetical protein
MWYVNNEKAFDWSGIRRYNSADDTQTIKDLSTAKIIQENTNRKISIEYISFVLLSHIIQ